MSVTIRKNSTKRIAYILSSAVLVREFHYDDMGDTNGSVTPGRVLDVMKEFEADRVYLDDSGTLHVSIHRNWCFTAYPSREVAERQLTPQAVTKYFAA